MIQGSRLRVEITHAETRYALADGGPLEIVHHGQPVSLTAGKPQAPAHPGGTVPATAQPAARDTRRHTARPPRTRAIKPWP
jgi:alpha,alpha-trehalose phosphorylase